VIAMQELCRVIDSVAICCMLCKFVPSLDGSCFAKTGLNAINYFSVIS
jgi:hypothetical protein